MNKTPIIGKVGQYDIHGATMRQVLVLGNASRSGDIDAQLKIAEEIVDSCTEGVENASQVLDGATATKILQVATSGDSSPDFTKA